MRAINYFSDLIPAGLEGQPPPDYADPEKGTRVAVLCASDFAPTDDTDRPLDSLLYSVRLSEVVATER